LTGWVGGATGLTSSVDDELTAGAGFGPVGGGETEADGLRKV
jgi:hypothetical protein